MSDEEKDEKREKLRQTIDQEAKKGNVVFWALEELAVAPLDKFVEQPLEGLLYDLNRLPEVIWTWIGDRKWINDFAVYQVIKRLYEDRAALRERVRVLEEANERCGGTK